MEGAFIQHDMAFSKASYSITSFSMTGRIFVLVLVGFYSHSFLIPGLTSVGEPFIHSFIHSSTNYSSKQSVNQSINQSVEVNGPVNSGGEFFI